MHIRNISSRDTRLFYGPWDEGRIGGLEDWRIGPVDPSICYRSVVSLGFRIQQRPDRLSLGPMLQQIESLMNCLCVEMLLYNNLLYLFEFNFCLLSLTYLIYMAASYIN